MRLLKFFLLLILLIYFSSCSSEDKTEITADCFEATIRKAVTDDSIPEDKIRALPPRDSLFLAIKAERKGLHRTFELLAKHAYEKNEGLFSRKAAELLIRHYLLSRDYKEAEFTASKAASKFPDEYYFKRAVCEADYWQHEDRDVLNAVKVLRGYAEAEADHELYLFEAVSAFRLELDDWRRYWIVLFNEIPSSDYLRRGWDYLLVNTDEPEMIFPGLNHLIAGKYHYSKGEYAAAADEYRRHIEENRGEELSEIVIRDMENAFLRSGRRIDGAKILESAASDTKNGDEYLFAAARLYRRAGYYRDAERCLNIITGKKDDNDISDRLLWYSLDVKVRSNLGSALDSLEYISEQWDDAVFFEDTLNNLCTSLIRRQRWADLKKMSFILGSSGPSSVSDRCRYIVNRASELGYIEPVEFSTPGKDLYYRILSGDSLSDFFDTQNNSSEGNVSAQNDEESYIEGLIKYDITDNIVDEVKKYSSSLSEAFFIKTAEKLAESGDPLESIRLMYQYGGDYSPSGFRAVYPAVYRDQIEAAAAENDVPVQLLFALVWKESGFERDIVSRAGAVGLSQLMPSTAEDVARRNRRDVADLTDPAENLFLGSWYLNWLNGYVGNTAAAVIAYNGGPGRVRSWLSSYPNLPLDLVYETIPVAETHDYGKKVLTAAVLYGIFYYNISAEETLSLFF